MKRYTFVIQVHPDGVTTLENLSTHERLQVLEMDSVGAQVESWLGELNGLSPSSRIPSPAPGPSSPASPPG